MQSSDPNGHFGREQPQWKTVRPRARWQSVTEAVARARGLPWEQFASKRGDWGRDLALYLGRKECGFSLRELGWRVGGLDYATVSAAIQRVRRKAENERKLMKLINRISANLIFET